MGLFKKGFRPLALKKVKFNLEDDVHVNIRELSSKELFGYQSQDAGKDTSNPSIVYDMLSKCVVDDDGNAIFDNADDLKDNFDIGFSSLIEIQKQILNLSGVPDAKKN